MQDPSRIHPRERGKGEVEKEEKKKGTGMVALQSQACRGCPSPREAATGRTGHIWPPLPARPGDHVGRASGLSSLLEL